MTESLISQRIRISTRQKSQSISEIQHQNLRVSFSILSFLHPEDNLPSNEKQLKSLTTRQEQQFNREYAPSPKIYQIPKNTTSPKVEFINLQDEKNKRKKQYVGEYFQSTQISTPKTNLNQFHKILGSSKKSLQKVIQTKRDESKSNCKSRQKSTKSIQSTKNISGKFNFTKRHLKGSSHYDLNMINSPYSPRVHKISSKGKSDHKKKPVKKILIICHDKKYQKSKSMRKKQIQKIPYKEKIVSNKQNIFQKQLVEKISFKSKHKKTLTCQIKQYVSQKHLPDFSSDYWSCGLDAKPKSKGKQKQQKFSKNSALKKLKQKPNLY